MAKAPHRKTVKRAGKPGRKAARNGAPVADFCAAARAALKRGEPDAISDKALQQVLTAAVKVYAAKVERRGHDVAPFTQGTVTATETVVTACGLIRAADLNMFDVAIWFHRPPGIE
jgi:glutamine cyclotransferase